MTVEEAYKTLINPKMAKKECNFKIKATGGGRVTNHDLLLAINQLSNRITILEEFAVEQRQFNKIILKRLDNLVSKNNLKE